MARYLKQHVETEIHDMTPETRNRFLNTLNTKMLAMVNSSDINEKIGGIVVRAQNGAAHSGAEFVLVAQAMEHLIDILGNAMEAKIVQASIS